MWYLPVGSKSLNIICWNGSLQPLLLWSKPAPGMLKRALAVAVDSAVCGAHSDPLTPLLKLVTAASSTHFFRYTGHFYIIFKLFLGTGSSKWVGWILRVFLRALHSLSLYICYFCWKTLHKCVSAHVDGVSKCAMPGNSPHPGVSSSSHLCDTRSESDH